MLISKFTSKKMVRLFLFFICIESSLIYSFDSGDLKSAVSWVWNEALHHPIPSGILSSIGAALILDQFKNGSRNREIENNKNISEARLVEAETERIRQQIALENNPEWQKSQINLMAAKVYQESDPELIKQRKRENELALQARELQNKNRKLETAMRQTDFLDYLQKRMKKVEEFLKKNELSDEEKSILYSELVRCRGTYKEINSPI